MIGFETIGNANITFFDNSVPVLTTDPWLDGNPYFGSWVHKYSIPKEQKNNIIKSINLSANIVPNALSKGIDS